MRLALPLAAVAASALSNACVSSRYEPRDAPWISHVYEGGMPRYRAGGRTYTSLADAMAPDPHAQRLLLDAESDFLWGGVLSIGGSVVLSLGLTDLLLVGALGESMFDTTSPTVGLALLGVGLSGMIGGLALAASGERDRLDAINLFNDRMFERWLQERGVEVPARPEGRAPLAPADAVIDP